MDVSELDFETFVQFFFARRPLAIGESFIDAFCPNGTPFHLAYPGSVVMHVDAMCTAFRDIGSRFELRQLNQGLWAMFSVGEFELQATLWNDAVPLAERVACLRAMRVPYLEFVAGHPAPVMENAFDMWWDMLMGSFWSQRGFHRDYGRLDSNDKAILDAVFETLDAILGSDDPRCQWYALHGLGHLHHPRVPERVTRFMQLHANELEPADVAWLEQCRDGNVM
jgi:hypothetical protein